MNKKQKQEWQQTFKLDELKSIEDACKIIPEVSSTKFVSSVDLDITLNLKEKQKKESIRGSFDLPNQLGGDKKVVVLCDEKDAKTALAAGASAAGLESLKGELLQNKVEFDVILATPAVMAKIVDLGRVLGPKGLMPNPKNGTVVTDVKKGVESFKAGKTSFKMNEGVIRGKVAKANMDPEKIAENVIAYLKAVFTDAKKFAGNPFKRVVLSSTMGPSIKLDVNDIIKRID